MNFLIKNFLKAKIKVDAVSTQKEFRQGGQLSRRGLGEAGTPAARDPLQKRQPTARQSGIVNKAKSSFSGKVRQ
jgi:hypothetical protein